MEHIKQVALQKALTLLAASGSQFAVIDPDGNTHGTLQVVAPKSPKKTVAYTHKHKFQAKYKYLEKVQALKPNDSIKFDLEPDEVQAFQSALAGGGGRFFGPGNYMTARNGNTVELLRLA